MNVYDSKEKENNETNLQDDRALTPENGGQVLLYSMPFKNRITA